MSDIIRDKLLLNYSTLTFSFFASYRQLSCPLFSFYIKYKLQHDQFTTIYFIRSHGIMYNPQQVLKKNIITCAIQCSSKLFVDHLQMNLKELNQFIMFFTKLQTPLFTKLLAGILPHLKFNKFGWIHFPNLQHTRVYTVQLSHFYCF